MRPTARGFSLPPPCQAPCPAHGATRRVEQVARLHHLLSLAAWGREMGTPPHPRPSCLIELSLSSREQSPGENGPVRPRDLE